jgi:hypothetical protein
MTSRFRILTACVGGVLALSALGAGTAQAARPEQPVFWHGGAAITASLATKTLSPGVYRLWWSAFGVGVTCTTASGTGKLEAKGRTKDEITYSGCKLVAQTANTTTEQTEEGAENANCTVKGGGAPAGEIKLTGLKSRLVWAEGKNVLLDLYEPEKQPAVTLEVGKVGEGACADIGKYAMDGSWLAAPSRANEEALVGNQLIESKKERARSKKARPTWK